MLTERQQLLLSKVIEGHVELGRPVGSRWLSEQPEIGWSSSTIRYELSALEEGGFLNHPHTSAGRVPTDSGYRYYVDRLLREGPQGLAPRRPEFPLELASMHREVDEAMRATTETLSRVTDLVAAVSAPPLHTATIKHVEVLLLQPRVALAVVISSSGAVTKRAFTFDDPVDAGLADWAASYLNERLAGMELGALMLRARLEDPELSQQERSFLEALSPAFSDLEETSEQTLYIDGAARLLTGDRFGDLSAVNDLMRMLERRVTMLAVLRSALGASTLYLRIGGENEEPELRAASVVAANYGLGHRTLGTVSVIGPVRMNYPQAIQSVRSAARALSSFVEEVYE
jgi:heat-inducible transcriptional repressor